MHKGSISFVLVCFGAFAQTPPVPTVDPATPPSDTTQQDPDSKLTPQQQREKQIRMFDLTDKGDPRLENRAQEKPIDGTTPSSSTPRSARPTTSKPFQGSAADSNAEDQTGPRVASQDDDVDSQEYTGPAVLSRSYTISRPSTPQQVKFAPHVALNSVYYGELSGLPSTAAGNALSTATGFGYTLSWGLTGRHLWRRDSLGVDYSGSQNRVGGYTGGSGTNQSLSLDYQHRYSRKLVFNLATSGSIYSQVYGLQNFGPTPAVPIADLNFAASPALQVLDNGTKQFANQASITYKKSSRLSFSATGGVFFAVRTNLYGNTGYQAQADVNYRQTRRMTIGLYYSFSDYMFSHRINVSNQHTFGGIYSYALGRTIQFKFRGGVTRIESQGLQTVEIDPFIALLLGQSSTIIEFYQRRLTTDVSAQITKDFRRGRIASFSYAHGVSPGNGLVLTSVQESMSAGFSMRLLRKYSASFSADRTTLLSVAQNIGDYTSKSVTSSISRPLNHNLNANFSFSYRVFNVANSPMFAQQLSISSGISWGPGENWLRRW